jgi:hypothetical protein
MNKIQRSYNARDIPLVEEVLSSLDSFNPLSIKHVYKERNERVDKLSKESLQLDLGKCSVEKLL